MKTRTVSRCTDDISPETDLRPWGLSQGDGGWGPHRRVMGGYRGQARSSGSGLAKGVGLHRNPSPSHAGAWAPSFHAIMTPSASTPNRGFMTRPAARPQDSRHKAGFVVTETCDHRDSVVTETCVCPYKNSTGSDRLRTETRPWTTHRQPATKAQAPENTNKNSDPGPDASDPPARSGGRGIRIPFFPDFRVCIPDKLFLALHGVPARDPARTVPSDTKSLRGPPKTPREFLTPRHPCLCGGPR